MTFSRTIYFLLALLLACLALSYQMLRPFLGSGILAMLFAIAFMPVYDWIEARLRRPTAAALITTLFIYLVILLPFGIIVAALADDIATQVKAINDASKTEGGLQPFLLTRVQAAIAWLAPRLRLPEDYIMSQVTARAQSGIQAMVAATGGFLVGAGASLVDFFIASVMIFFFLREGHKIHDALVDFMPLSQSDAEGLLGVVRDTIKANFYGVVGVAVVQGGLTLVGLLIAAVPSALTWAAFATVFACIPMVGPPLVWVPATIWLASTGHPGAAVFLAAWGVLVVGLADNFLRPALVGGKTHQNSMLIFFSLIGGTAAFGILGLFVGPLLISVTIAVFKVLRREMGEEKSAILPPTAT